MPVSIQFGLLDKQVSRNGILSDPYMYLTKCYPFIDWPILRKEASKMPGKLCHRRWDAPNATNPWNAYQTRLVLRSSKKDIPLSYLGASGVSSCQAEVFVFEMQERR